MATTPPSDLGFTYVAPAPDEVRVYHRDRLATTLRGDRARAFLATAATCLPDVLQQQMARLTGNYKRGTERRARQHPRNQPDRTPDDE